VEQDHRYDEVHRHGKRVAQDGVESELRGYDAKQETCGQ
jgi:hypothetical protein